MSHNSKYKFAHLIGWAFTGFVFSVFSVLFIMFCLRNVLSMTLFELNVWSLFVFSPLVEELFRFIVIRYIIISKYSLKKIDMIIFGFAWSVIDAFTKITLALDHLLIDQILIAFPIVTSMHIINSIIEFNSNRRILFCIIFHFVFNLSSQRLMSQYGAYIYLSVMIPAFFVFGILLSRRLKSTS